MNKKEKTANDVETKTARRSRIEQSDVPTHSIDEAIRIPQAIVDNYGGQAATPIQVAVALNMSPQSGHFRTLCGAAMAYGLTSGGYNASEIKIELLGKRIVMPTEENDDLSAKREAVFKPKIFNSFFTKYDGSPIPARNIGINVLAEMGVPRERAESVYEMVIETARVVHFLVEIKDKLYITLNNRNTHIQTNSETSIEVNSHSTTGDIKPDEDESLNGKNTEYANVSTQQNQLNRRVFVTHGKNRTFIEPIKKLLGFGELTPVVSVERESVSKPIPDKVMDDMRSCGAAIIHVDEETKMIDQDAKEHTIINSNVLIEIGAAMALYGRRFILLVKNGVTLPSNLQGLYEVRYDGDSLDGNTTIRLLEAINDIKNNPLPKRES